MRIRSASAALGVVGLLSVVLGGCSDVNDAVDKAQNSVDKVQGKAGVCGKALGIVDLDPSLDFDKAKAEAGEKADQLRDLANQVGEQSVRDNLFALADGYVQLEQNKVDHMRGFSGWLQQNIDKLGNLKDACL